MKCPKCQFENREDVIFCEECGAKLEQTCPECKAEIPLDRKFCGKCGHDLREAIKEPPIDYNKPQSYTPKHLQEKILTTRSSLEGERKIVTVLFADVANYTSISEKLDPEEVLQIMDGAFKIMMDETHKYEGTINQFTGDGIMAIFGAPVAHENHAQRACYTALSIQNAMADYSVKIERDYGLEFKIRIGINSGPVIVSAIGDDLRMDYTAVGDTTNLASRMEDQANPGSIFVSANTYKIAERYFDFTHVGKTEVKGKKEPQEVYELLKTSEVVTRIDESVAKGLTRFVGRKNSMAALMDAYDLVKSGEGQVVGVVGEAGVGKSRLVLEMRNRLPENTYKYLEGQCLQYGGSILYKPILDILRSLFDIKDNDREFVINKKVKEKILANNNLDHTLPAFQDLLSVKVDDESFTKLEPKQKREKIFESIRDLLISVSQEKPLVVVVEDLHWIDDTSEEVLNYLVEWIAGSPIMLILLYRTEYRHKWSSKTYYRKVGLDHLRKESSIQLVQAMLADGAVAPELRDLILARAAGNPLFMEEFTRTLMENGTIQKEDDQYVLSHTMGELQVPNTVQDIIAARMDRLEENLKRTMQIAAVIGRDFAFRILQIITGMREELKSYLLNLQGLEFIYEKRLFPELEYIFKHALTQEVAYNSLLLKRRKQIHENIGKAIEDLYSERLEEFYEMLAYHYSKSESFEKAYYFLKLSGIKAFENYSNYESYYFYKEALDSLKHLPENEETKKKNIEVAKLISIPMLYLMFPEESLTILQNGVRFSREIGDKKSLSAFYVYISRYYTFKGNPLEGTEYVEPRFNEAKKAQDTNLMVPLSVALCFSYSHSGYMFKASGILSDVIALLEKENRKNDYFDMQFSVYAWLCTHYGFCLSHLGNFDKAKDYLEKGLGLGIENNDKYIIGVSHYYYSVLYSIQGDGKRTIEHSTKGLNYYQEGNLLSHTGHSWLNLGYGHYLLGDLDTAKKYAEKGYAIYRDISTTYAIFTFPKMLSDICFDLGDIATAHNYVEEAFDLSTKTNNRYGEGESIILLGRILGKMSRTAESEKNIIQGIKIFEELKLRPFLSKGYFYLGELYANTDRKEEAYLHLSKALSICKEMEIGYLPDKIQEVLDRL